MSEYAIRLATDEDVEYIAANLRQQDKDEVLAAAGLSPRLALKYTVNVSRDSYVGTVDGRPVALFGVSEGTALTPAAIPWLVGTPELEKHARRFARSSRENLRELVIRDHKLLENYVDARNTYAVRWLRWLGFTVHEAKPFGVERLPFHRFTMVTDNV